MSVQDSETPSGTSPDPAATAVHATGVHDVTVHSPLLHEVANQQFPANALYVVATPIGNLADLTLRALHVLSIVDAVACEDSRNTATLLARHGLKKSLIAAHQHNEREVAQQLIARLRDGARIALVSDAGTPAVSDPGARIVDAVIQAGLRVIPLPGPSAALAALSASGLLDEQFHFAGFLPAKAGQRDDAMRALLSMPAALVFYEAPHRIKETVKAMESVFGPDRRIMLARELTKLFEEIHRCRLGDASAWLADSPQREKGEYVLVLEGADVNDHAKDREAERVLAILLKECSVSQAAALTAQITGARKKQLYELALQWKKD